MRARVRAVEGLVLLLRRLLLRLRLLLVPVSVAVVAVGAVRSTVKAVVRPS